MNKNKANNIIEKLVDYHRRNNQIETFCLVGSFVDQKIKLPNDIDCLILTKEELSYNYIKKLISSFKENLRLKYLDNSFRVSLGKVTFGLGYSYNQSFYEEVDEIMKGNKLFCETKPWVIGGNIPEILLTDIFSANIMFDKPEKFGILQNNLRKKYPLKLKKKLEKDLTNEYNLKTHMVEKTIENGDLVRADIGIGELLILLIRLTYGKNGLYLPPIKHIANNIQGLSEDTKKVIIELHEIPKLTLRTDKLKEINRIGLNITNNK